MSDVLVLGAGVIGLCAADTLLAAGHRVTIWTRDDPARTTSTVAAAIWYPYLTGSDERVRRWAAATFRRLQQLAGDPATGVRMIRCVERRAAAGPRPWWSALGGSEPPLPGRPHDVVTVVPLCETPRYLPWLLQRCRSRGAGLEHRTVTSLAEACGVAPVVVNCTGLGARELCGDAALRPARGQVLRVAPTGLDHAIIDDTDPGQPFYLLPRRDDLVLGGTLQLDDQRVAVDAADSARIRAGCGALHAAAATAVERGVAVGLRPWRPTVRLEPERMAGGGVVVHDYGHGGSGFTLAWGCAAEVAALVAG